MYIETQRLIIRDWTLEDVNDMYAYAKDPRVGPMAGWKPHKNRVETKNIIEDMIKQQEAFAVELKEDHKVIGSIGLHKKVPLEKWKNYRQREIGYVLSPEYWGHGYIPEAVKAFISYGFNDLDLELIWCTCYNNNHNSKRVIEKCGFKKVYGYWAKTPLLKQDKTMSAYYWIRREEYDKGGL